jgi:hypothetical protein
MQRALWGGALLLALAAGPAAAQQGQWLLKLGAGWAPPLGSYNTFLNDGWQGQLGAAYRPRGGLVGASIEFTRSWNNIDDRYLASIGLPRGQSRLWSLTLNGIAGPFNRAARVQPYLIGGGGFYHRTVDFYGGTVAVPVAVPWWGAVGFVPANTVLASFGDDAFGLNGGLGLVFPLRGGAGVFLEARYHYAWTSGTHSEVLPVIIGFAYQY